MIEVITRKQAAKEMAVTTDCVAYMVQLGYLERVFHPVTQQLEITEDSVVYQLAEFMLAGWPPTE